VRPSTARDGACLLEHLHVLGDRRLEHAEARGRIADGRRPAPGGLLLAQLSVTLERPPEPRTHYWIGTVPHMWSHGQTWRLLSLSRCLL
jgi:hypothetical protein